MDERRMDVLVLSETKMRGKGEVVFGDARGRISGVHGRMRAKEGVAIVLSEEMWLNVKEWKEVSSRMMWVRLAIGGERWVVVGAYGPGSEHSLEERRKFWDELNECVEGFERRERVVVCGDLNAKVGDM